MRLSICLTAACVMLAGCNKPADTAAANDAMAINDSMAGANMAGNASMTPAAMTTLNETSWEFTDPKTKKPIQESVDAAGKYIGVSGKDHFDHGTAAMKGGKACFDSAMDKEGELCWTNPMIAVGQSGEVTSDKGEKLTVKRVAYVPRTM